MAGRAGTRCRGEEVVIASLSKRLPFFYGWIIVAVCFVTMAVAVNARIAFSLLFPPILDEFGWDRGTTAGAFSFGFIVSAIMSPSLGGQAWPAGRERTWGGPDRFGTAVGDAGAETVAALRDTRHAGGWRQRMPRVHRPGTVPAQLVRPPARARDEPRVYVMIAAQGLLGYGITSVIGAIPAEIFQGRHYGTIFGTLMLASIGGGAVGPWLTGAVHDATGSYTIAFWIGIGASLLSVIAIWLA